MEISVLKTASDVLKKERAQHSRRLKHLQLTQTLAATQREEIDALLASETRMQCSMREMEKQVVEKTKERASLRKGRLG